MTEKEPAQAAAALTTQADVRAARVDAALKMLAMQNPFGQAFAEYEARLDTGRKASEVYANDERREAVNRATAAVAGVLAITGAPPPGTLPVDFDVRGKSDTSLFLEIAGRAALSAQWYEALIAKGAMLSCAPELVPYVEVGLPEAVARRFFDVRCPPEEAGKIYRMIYHNLTTPYEGDASAAAVAANVPRVELSPTPKKPLQRMDMAAASARAGKAAAVRKKKGGKKK